MLISLVTNASGAATRRPCIISRMVATELLSSTRFLTEPEVEKAPSRRKALMHTFASLHVKLCFLVAKGTRRDRRGRSLQTTAATQCTPNVSRAFSVIAMDAIRNISWSSIPADMLHLTSATTYSHFDRDASSRLRSASRVDAVASSLGFALANV